MEGKEEKEEEGELSGPFCAALPLDSGALTRAGSQQTPAESGR